jgi:hypothetical protein
MSDESMSSFGKSAALKEVSKLQRGLQQLELEFIKDVVAAVGSERAVGVRAALLGDIAARSTAGLLTRQHCIRRRSTLGIASFKWNPRYGASSSSSESSKQLVNLYLLIDEYLFYCCFDVLV